MRNHFQKFQMLYVYYKCLLPCMNLCKIRTHKLLLPTMYIYVSEMKKKTKKTSPINFFKTIITKFRSKNSFRREKNKQTVRIVYFKLFPRWQSRAISRSSQIVNWRCIYKCCTLIPCLTWFLWQEKYHGSIIPSLFVQIFLEYKSRIIEDYLYSEVVIFYAIFGSL